MNAPRRIWLDPAALEDIPELDREIPGNGDVPYVRADIADEMLMALKYAEPLVEEWRYYQEDGGNAQPFYDETLAPIKNAIAKAEGGTEMPA